MKSVRIASIAFLGLTACAKTSFDAKKSETLSKNSVFGQNDASGQIRQPGSSRDANGNLNQFFNEEEAAGRVPTNANEEVLVTLICSDSRSEKNTNLKEAIASNLPVQFEVNGANCPTTAAKLKELGIKGKITKADVMAMCPNAVGSKFSTASLMINGSDGDVGSSKSLEILYARNKDTDVASEMADENCDKRSSPLVIHRASDPSNPQPIALSSIEDGVKFDLLGRNNDYQSVQISWFTNHDYMLLTLPDEDGEVNGIDELFGDNTQGPDGQFADNGYAALAKYDGTTSDGYFRISNADGRIDRNDPIYRKLRLWVDLNLDGVAEKHELVSLRSIGLEYIDLDFSSDYAEQDEHGNETKMKSVVGYNDGSLDLIFDLWFAYNLGGNQ